MKNKGMKKGTKKKIPNFRKGINQFPEMKENERKLSRREPCSSTIEVSVENTTHDTRHMWICIHGMKPSRYRTLYSPINQLA